MRSFTFSYWLGLVLETGTILRACSWGCPVQTRRAPSGARQGLTTLEEERVLWQSRSQQEGAAQGPQQLRPSLT